MRLVNDKVLVTDLGGVANEGMVVLPQQAVKVRGVYPGRGGCHEDVVGWRLPSVLQPGTGFGVVLADVRLQYWQLVAGLDVLDVRVVLELI